MIIIWKDIQIICRDLGDHSNIDEIIALLGMEIHTGFCFTAIWSVTARTIVHQMRLFFPFMLLSDKIICNFCSEWLQSVQPRVYMISGEKKQMWVILLWQYIHYMCWGHLGHRLWGALYISHMRLSCYPSIWKVVWKSYWMHAVESLNISFYTFGYLLKNTHYCFCW